MTEIRISVRNLAPADGVSLTPVWFGFHNGSFDLYDTGFAASAGLEAMAEDGNAAGLATELRAADADGQGGLVTGAAGPITSGEATSRIVAVDSLSNGWLSLTAMILPSNDAFIGTGEAIEVFDAKGRFLGAQTHVFTGADVLDAGTEENTELDAAFINQTAPNTGVVEGGAVRQHAGFNGSVGNPGGEAIILGGTDAFGKEIGVEGGDFTRPGYEVAVIHVNTVRHMTGTDGRNGLFGGRDDDLIDAQGGRDELFGRSGWDDLDGGAGDDLVFGGRGEDRLQGGEGDDFLRGGADTDSFLFGTGGGDDVIADFAAYAGGDRLVLALEGIGGLDDLAALAIDTRRGLVIESGSDSLLLRGVELDDLVAGENLFFATLLA